MRETRRLGDVRVEDAPACGALVDDRIDERAARVGRQIAHSESLEELLADDLSAQRRLGASPISMKAATLDVIAPVQ